MEKEEILSGIIMELRRGTIILCVLSQLSKPMYGYSLVQVLSEKGVAVEANTLYPLLRRLETQGLLKSQWETGVTSKPRKYYIITELGTEIYGIIKNQWFSITKSMELLMKEKNHE